MRCSFTYEIFLQPFNGQPVCSQKCVCYVDKFPGIYPRSTSYARSNKIIIMHCKRPLLHWSWLPSIEDVCGRKWSSFSGCGFIDLIFFPDTTWQSEFPVRSGHSVFSYRWEGRWKREKGVEEREGGRGGMEEEIERVGREGVSEREILCQHSTISEVYFDDDSSVDYQHFTRVVKAKTAACRYVRFRWQTCFFFFFISSDFSVIIWGRRNGVGYHYFTESCPVRPPPLTPHVPYLFYMSLLSRRFIKISEITYANPVERAHTHARPHARTHTHVRLYYRTCVQNNNKHFYKFNIVLFCTFSRQVNAFTIYYHYYT